MIPAIQKEWLRFWKVSIQTVLAPVLTALLFLLVFGHTLRNRLEPYPGVDYTVFLVPGLAMMSVSQNSFANAMGLSSLSLWLIKTGYKLRHGQLSDN